jgi:hypothetical protein
MTVLPKSPFWEWPENLVRAEAAGYLVDLDPATGTVAIYGVSGTAHYWLADGRFEDGEIRDADISDDVRAALSEALRGVIN